MTRQRRLLTVAGVALLGLAQLGFAAAARAYDEPTLTIAPNVNDPAIVDTNPTRGSNLVWLAADPARRVGKLLVFLPTGGPTNLPTEFKELGTEAGRLGYHTIILAYRNEAPIAAAPPAGCGNGEDPPDLPKDCAFNIRTEILTGADVSPVVSVNPANSIENRLNKLLQYLVASRPAGEGWSQFVDSSGLEPKWSETVIVGSSLGAGEAVLVAAKHSVSRVALMHGWTDAHHGWVQAPAATPSSRYFTLIHARDAFFGRTCYAYEKLGLAPSCPLPGFTGPLVATNPLLVENRQPPFNGERQLVFNIEPGSFAGMGDWYHQSTSRDGWIAREADGTPSKKLLNAWRSTLGDSDADTWLDLVDNCPQLANPAQLDTDGDHIGDGCDLSVSTPGAAGGTVGATLSLSLGPPASFGAFTPGLAKDYETATTANVISTAADATLSVADPSSVATGHLVNGAFSLPSPLRARARNTANTGTAYNTVGSSASPLNLLTYGGPISNDAVALQFSQHIGATDALRTGSYSKTLTFTLSTTSP